MMSALDSPAFAAHEIELLERAALAYGVELSYTDVWGREHRATPEVLKQILEPLGVPAGSAAEIEKALEARTAERWQHPVDPTIVVRENAEWIELRIPAARKGTSLKLEIEWESGDLEHHWFWAPELRTLQTAYVNCCDFIAKRLPLPKLLRPGYHKIRLHWMKQPQLETFAVANFIVCPLHAKRVERRLAGLALSLYGLRSARNWGCGDFTDLRSVIDAFAPAGAAFIALNPLHALANREPYNISPYLPECAFFRNFIYLDVEKTARETAGGLRLLEGTQAEINALRFSEFVEYQRVAAVKLQVLEKVFERFTANGGSADFDLYHANQGQLLEDYAAYCVLWEEMHRRDGNVWLWTDWPEEYRDPASAAVQEFTQKHSLRVLFFKFLHWQLSRQAAEAHAYALGKGMPIGVYHDLALATDRTGADLWAQRRFYVPGAKVGAPPDALAPAGQDWSFPPPNRGAHRADGYRLFAQSIRSAAADGGALRIDHVMRFFHLYWIPQNCDARQGAYVRDYAEDLLGILALESERGNFVVIGEDLGTVTGEVRSVLKEKGILSYRLFLFEHDDAGRFHPPAAYPEHALVSTTTHDLPTLGGFWIHRDIDARKAAGLADEEAYKTQMADREREIQGMKQAMKDAGFENDPLGFVLATPCLLAVVNQEDLTGELDQQNLPGSTWQYPNWRRKMKVTVEQLDAPAAKFGLAVRRSGRA